VVLWNNAVKPHLQKPCHETSLGMGFVSKSQSGRQVLCPAAVQRATGKGSFGSERPCSLLPAFGRVQGQQDEG